MSSLLPKSLEGWAESKRRFMRLAAAESDPEQRRVYLKAVNYCDRRMGRILTEKRKLRLLLSASVLTILFAVQGCCTVKGALDDVGFLLKTTSENIRPEAE